MNKTEGCMSVLPSELVVADPEPPIRPVAPGNTVEMCVRWLLAACSLGAAALHFAYSPSHLAEYWLYGIFFVVLALSQMFWAIGVGFRPWRRSLVGGIAG